MRSDSWSQEWPGGARGALAPPTGARSRAASGPSRREFLRSCGASALALAAIEMVPGAFVVHRVEAAIPPPDQLEALGAVALAKARSLGASYADIRVNRYRTQ